MLQLTVAYVLFLAAPVLSGATPAKPIAQESAMNKGIPSWNTMIFCPLTSHQWMIAFMSRPSMT